MQISTFVIRNTIFLFVYNDFWADRADGCKINRNFEKSKLKKPPSTMQQAGVTSKALNSTMEEFYLISTIFFVETKPCPELTEGSPAASL